LNLFTTLQAHPRLQRITPFLALSRTPHGVIDMAAPAAAALLCLGRFPALPVILVGLITVFAGYTAVYALNDLVDLGIDRRKVAAGGLKDGENDLDGMMIRHPLAKGTLGFGAGLAWAGGWSLVAVAGAWWLNPVCLLVFVTGCLLETLYCKLWQVTPLRALVNGAVKTMGPLAAVFAVNPSPSPLYLLVLFFWLFVWEIGGQNIPNDWSDYEEDLRFNARTIPILFGLRRSAILITICLTLTPFLNIAVLWISPLQFSLPLLLAVAANNFYLLLYPVYLLNENPRRAAAMNLFNKASYYPLAMLVLVLVHFIA
jgi:4-hydroxybenzoate polyprenyltransferase